MAAWADENKGLERLCRNTSRPANAEKRLSRTPNGNVRYQSKTAYRDGTNDVNFEPRDVIARLAALMPNPRVNLTRVPRALSATYWTDPGPVDTSELGRQYGYQYTTKIPKFDPNQHKLLNQLDLA